MSALDRMHPAVSRWFGETFAAPADAQAGGWPHIQDGRSARARGL